MANLNSNSLNVSRPANPQPAGESENSARGANNSSSPDSGNNRGESSQADNYNDASFPDRTAPPNDPNEELNSRGDVPAGNEADARVEQPIKKLVIIERIVQDADIPSPQDGEYQPCPRGDSTEGVRDTWLPTAPTPGTWGDNAAGYSKFQIRTDAECKSADTIFLHYTGTCQYNTNSQPTGIGDLKSHHDGAKYTSAHFYVFGNGRIIQLMDFDKTSYTQGDGVKGLHVSGEPDSEVVKSRLGLTGIYDFNPNSYSYSMEIASGDMNHGSLTDAQIEAVVYTIRYIKKMSRERFGVSIDANKIWRGFPDIPDSTDAGSYRYGDDRDKDEDGNEKTTRDITFTNIFGHLLGHKDACATACPGYRFPWESILTKLGVFPPTEEEKERARTSIETVFTELDALTDEELDTAATYSTRKNAVWTSSLPEFMKQQQTPKRPFDYYYNPDMSYWDGDKDVEYLVWYRRYVDVIDEDFYDVRAEWTNPVTKERMLPLQDAFIQGIYDERGEQKYPADSYVVVTYEAE